MVTAILLIANRLSVVATEYCSWVCFSQAGALLLALFTSYRGKLLPPRGETPREMIAAHLPGARCSLSPEGQRTPAKDAVDGIDNRHQPHLPLVCSKRVCAKQVRLDEGCEALQHHASFSIPIPSAVNAVKRFERVLDQRWRKRRRGRDIDGVFVRIVWDVSLKWTRAHKHHDTPAE